MSNSRSVTETALGTHIMPLARGVKQEGNECGDSWSFSRYRDLQSFATVEVYSGPLHLLYVGRIKTLFTIYFSIYKLQQ